MNELKNRSRLTDLRERTCGCWIEGRGGRREGIVREFGTDMYTVLCLKRIIN